MNYIRVDKALEGVDLIAKNDGEKFDKDSAKYAIQTTEIEDVVPVVRCKDCMFWDTEKIGMVDECVCKLHSIEGIYSKYKLPSDFCSYGERK